MGKTLRTTALLVALFSALALGGAFAFQYWGGLAPCPLCVWQRYPHGAAIAAALLAYLIPVTFLQRGFLGLAGLALLAGAAIAAFHIGVEQKWWEGLPSCAGGTDIGKMSIDDLKKNVTNAGPRCDEPTEILFGLSMATYNFILSAIVGLGALFMAARRKKRR